MKKQQDEMPTEEGVLSKAVLQKHFDDMDEKDRNGLIMVAHMADSDPLNMLGALIVKAQEDSHYASTPKFMMVQ